MKDYRLYRINPDGGFTSGDDFRAVDDASAVVEARRMAHTGVIEIWQGTRQVARVDPAS
jgi:hypothetical protein